MDGAGYPATDLLANVASIPDDVAVMALNHDVDLALLLVAVVKELERPLGPFGLAQELRRNEALEDCPATPTPTAIRRSAAPG